MTRKRYTGKNKPARLVLTQSEADILLCMLQEHEAFENVSLGGKPGILAPARSRIMAKLGVELARVSGATLRGSGR